MTEITGQIEILDDGTETCLVYAPFDKGLEYLTERGHTLVSLEENARLRIQEGSEQDVSIDGNWVREGVLYVPGKGKFLTKNSPVMQNPKEATDAHGKINDFYLTGRQVEFALEDSVELSVKSIPTNRFGEDEITTYAFGVFARQYGEFLEEAGIDSMPIYTTYLQEKPFAGQLWFGSLGCGSGLSGSSGGLNGYVRLRGVKIDAESASQRKVHFSNEPARQIRIPISRMPPTPNLEGMSDSDFAHFLNYIQDEGGYKTR